MKERSNLGALGLPVVVGWFCAATLLVASVMTLLLAYDITAAELPAQPAGHPNLLRASVTFFANERQRYSQEVISGLLYFAGFAALVAIALLLARRHSLDPLSMLMAGALAIGATLGIASGLLSLGAEQAAIDPHVCDCKYSASQLIAQDRGLILINSSADWLLYGFFALAAVAFAIAALSKIGWAMGRGWRYLSGVIALLFVVGLVARSTGADSLSDAVQGFGGGILLPVWALWTGYKLRDWLLPVAAPEAPPDVPPVPAPLS